MESWEAMACAIDGKTKDVAKALHLTTALVYKWQEPSADFTDSGTFNPLDRLETVIQETLSCGTPEEKAYAPLRYLAEKFNLCCFPIVRKHADADDLAKDLMKTITDFGQLTAISAEAFGDGYISRNDALRINKEGWELVNQVLHFLELVNSAIDDRPFALRWLDRQKDQKNVVNLKK
ncbi:MAG: hypothetical protein JW902_15950 [Syntrophaceae bacterium]|nr:hypothetical protein [Syntrophaceae bacterium]